MNDKEQPGMEVHSNGCVTHFFLYAGVLTGKPRIE